MHELCQPFGWTSIDLRDCFYLFDCKGFFVLGGFWQRGERPWIGWVTGSLGGSQWVFDESLCLAVFIFFFYFDCLCRSLSGGTESAEEGSEPNKEVKRTGGYNDKEKGCQSVASPAR